MSKRCQGSALRNPVGPLSFVSRRTEDYKREPARRVETVTNAQERHVAQERREEEEEPAGEPGMKNKK